MDCSRRPLRRGVEAILTHAVSSIYDLPAAHFTTGLFDLLTAIGLAVFASYTALDLGARIRGPVAGPRWPWIAASHSSSAR